MPIYLAFRIDIKIICCHLIYQVKIALLKNIVFCDWDDIFDINNMYNLQL